MNEWVARLFGLGAVGAPLLLLAVFGLSTFFTTRLGEKTMARWTAACVSFGLFSVVGMLLAMLWTGDREVQVEVGDWVALPSEHFHFRVKFLFDRLSVPFAALTFILVGVTGSFANRYLHREPGYRRFFLYFAVFLLGMVVASLAGTIETLFMGWELVGLASALLVAFFHERAAPVFNAQRIWTVYRFSDAAFLIAALTLHRLSGGGDFAALTGSGPWPGSEAAIAPAAALGVGLLLLIAAAGKSALVPFSGWLPRAMEGPTPSSAVFYGALSVHLGTYLLLRVDPILKASPPLCACVVLIGAASAVFGVVAGRVQTDVKTALAYASLTQVGIITAEIGLGFRYLALVHIIGHACQRTLQFLRSPSLLHDYHMLENALGGPIPRAPSFTERRLPSEARRRLYRVGLERGRLDAALDRFIVRPFVLSFRWCDRMEARWTGFLAGRRDRPHDHDPRRRHDPVALTPPAGEDHS
ncbi:proton-conducting transporter membrane subunit [Planctomyces sp. SH-PL62]|uniref:proton-conducting transporter transmembrane domain-containing protein n=1 Tax=Planctomyces sp. SH-PL62 TaxID=1636152 RepID=UPI00078CA46F|nr:proton-conducting transporter membrane subunit [Planctomyces sp. SH-PL62]AMV37034.1 NADH-quinone oxidoreductase subunit 12 [Planctomyces sp. SH-PL62]